MNTRQAILAAADHISGRPDLYNFGSGYVPVAPTDCACALARIGAFLSESALPVRQQPGTQAHKEWADVATFLGHAHAPEFYGQLHLLVGSNAWQIHPPLCVKALRLYAEKYFPAPKPPDWEAIAGKRTVLPDMVSQEVSNAGV